MRCTVLVCQYVLCTSEGCSCQCMQAARAGGNWTRGLQGTGGATAAYCSTSTSFVQWILRVHLQGFVPTRPGGVNPNDARRLAPQGASPGPSPSAAATGHGRGQVQRDPYRPV